MEPTRPFATNIWQRIYESLWEIFHIFFRHYNFPCQLELVAVGNPNADSPAFLSGNYTLTVRRLLRALRGTDCWLLVANSRGSNVWCAAGMNEFTEHDVIDAINVSNIGHKVHHRRLIAPPYGAPGIDARAVKRETGFNIIWGPTHLDDIPRFIKNNYKRTNDMLQVQFGFQDRMEQALSTSLAYSLTIAVLALFWPRYIFSVVGMIFFSYCFAFALWNVFPRERRWLHTLSVGAVLSVLLVLFGQLCGWSAMEFLQWEATLVGIMVLLGGDACGSTPIYKTTIKHWLTEGNYESLFDPIIDPARCTNCMACVLVCPKDVYAARRSDEKKVVSVHPQECIECLACVKQCGDDAIYNRAGRYKGDVKTIPKLHEIMTRGWEHLRVEDRWVGVPTKLRSGLPIVVEASPASPDGKTAAAVGGVPAATETLENCRRSGDDGVVGARRRPHSTRRFQ